ncbi:hypothetical protein SCHPADRAFT_636397 [Schizopora paradoxa]|uniref:Secreted protein n=1 Tax=Schizopora paradoxa TaxID=27342 RepID=A0A0H2R785_9AGAM|nr:hypothetical protein SCHPADRAFT_636397 [Schizopora paradoxa]
MTLLGWLLIGIPYYGSVSVCELKYCSTISTARLIRPHGIEEVLPRTTISVNVSKEEYISFEITTSLGCVFSG